MRLFRSKANDLLEQHLRRTGIDEIWWPHAKTAITFCEARRWFEPVLSAEGLLDSRDVVALLGLEPFVRGGIDWGAHQGLDDSASCQFFEEVAEG
jgi:hypothetical protein